MATAPGPAMELFGRVAFELTKMRPLMPTYLHLLLAALFPIYTAAHASLARPSSAAPPEKKVQREDGDSDDDGEVVQKIEGLTPSDAIMFPLMAGGTLASLYLLLQWLKDPDLLSRMLSVYFSQMGLFFGAKFLKDIFSIMRSFILPTQYSSSGKIWKANLEKRHFRSQQSQDESCHPSPLPGMFGRIPLPNRLSSAIWSLRKLVYSKATLRLHIHKVITINSAVDLLDVFACTLSSLIVAWHFFISKPWWLTNFLGFSFSYGTMQLITPTTGWTGTLILCALFVYDIYFVFFTPMMVAVATKLDVPIKLLFPRPDRCVLPVGSLEGSDAMNEYMDCLAKKRTMAMLGLGDIVIPGMMLAFALRFDLYVFYLKKQKNKSAQPSEQDFKPNQPEKSKYRSATGAWGERFWTSRKNHSAELQAKKFPKPYFHASVIGYLAGMITTVVVMQVAEHAQPALLYLVPGVLSSLWGTALLRGDLKVLWNYTEDFEDVDKDKLREKDKKEKGSADMPIEAEKDKDTVAVTATEPDPSEPKPKSVEDKQSDPTYKKEKSSDKASCRQLIHFEVLLPTSKSAPRTRSRATSTSIPKSERIPVLKPKSQRSSSDESYDVLPDVRADHEILEKLSREITAEKEKEKEEGRPEKRRRKG